MEYNNNKHNENNNLNSYAFANVELSSMRLLVYAEDLIVRMIVEFFLIFFPSIQLLFINSNCKTVFVQKFNMKILK